jgi:hypothetical protein
LKPPHGACDNGARPRTVGENEIRDPYFTGQISTRHGLAILVRERKIRHLTVIDFWFAGASKKGKAQQKQCESFHDDVCLVRRMATMNTLAANASETANETENEGRFMAAARCTP